MVQAMITATDTAQIIARLQQESAHVADTAWTTVALARATNYLGHLPAGLMVL